ncbi:MAG: hypothetical protein ACLQVI_32020, partial [Polyangiaceae bacterium]
MTERHPCVANRLRTSLFVGAIGLALWACGPTPAPRPTTPSPAATSPRLTPAQASAAEGARLVSQESGCLAHWTPACGDLAIRFRRDCPLPLRDEKR